MLEVLEAGILTTVQDSGRRDALDLGVPVSGACDPWALAVANVLIGNEPTAAALEMTVLGGRFRVLEDMWIGVAGAAMDGGPRPWRSHQLRKGEGIGFGGSDGSARTYLAVPGGVDVPLVLGSRSTCLVGAFGGMSGRALQAGDLVRPSKAGAGPARGWPGPLSGDSPALVRVIRGPEAEGFQGLVENEWEVTIRSNRQGIRLEGPRLPVRPGAMLSRPVTWGTIQLPPDGQPIVLLADAQTVGGYPIVGVVIAADLPLVGQLAPVDTVRFVEVSVEQAQQALREQAATFERLRTEMIAP